MSRSRYLITEPDKPHFLTCTVVEWLPVFSFPENVDLLLESWRFLRERMGLRLYGYVVMENHLHFVAQADHLDKCLASFKSFTARRIISQLERNGAESLLMRLSWSKMTFKADREHQFWQEGSHAELVLSDSMMREKLEYIHGNPLRRGYIDRAEQWRYSSARNYIGEPGLIEIDRWW
ncbi:MAG TPA: transposase [Geobacter sp.]|nr:transposase [Geobacter sp.]